MASDSLYTTVYMYIHVHVHVLSLNLYPWTRPNGLWIVDSLYTWLASTDIYGEVIRAAVLPDGQSQAWSR